MARYQKHEAQDWAWDFLKDQWTTIMTPFTPDNRVDEDGLRRNIRYIRKPGYPGRWLHLGHGRVLEPHL